jgi:macrodomain Ter protein organizer (MatP/YcbG family)
MNEPQRRPALKRAADADVHPTLPAKSELSDLRRRKGSSTSDTLLDPRGTKTVRIGVDLPKALRKELRKEAKRRGISLSELITAMLTSASRG